MSDALMTQEEFEALGQWVRAEAKLAALEAQAPRNNRSEEVHARISQARMVAANAEHDFGEMVL